MRKTLMAISGEDAAYKVRRIDWLVIESWCACSATTSLQWRSTGCGLISARLWTGCIKSQKTIPTNLWNKSFYIYVLGTRWIWGLRISVSTFTPCILCIAVYPVYLYLGHFLGSGPPRVCNIHGVQNENCNTAAHIIPLHGVRSARTCGRTCVFGANFEWARLKGRLLVFAVEEVNLGNLFFTDFSLEA